MRMHTAGEQHANTGIGKRDDMFNQMNTRIASQAQGSKRDIATNHINNQTTEDNHHKQRKD